MSLYLIANGPAPTTAAQALVTTSATLATLLQVKLEDDFGRVGKIVEWGVSFDGSAAATPFRCELISTMAIKATITEHVPAGIINLDPQAGASVDTKPFDFTAAAEGTGYTSSAEGSIVATRMFDVQQIAPTAQYVKQWPLGREPEFADTEYLRIRVWGDGTIKAYCYVILEV